jgi:hypothetical protein
VNSIHFGAQIFIFETISLILRLCRKMIHTVRDIHHRGESLRNTKNVLESLNLTLAGATKKPTLSINENNQQNNKFFFQYFKRSVPLSPPLSLSISEKTIVIGSSFKDLNLTSNL